MRNDAADPEADAVRSSWARDRFGSQLSSIPRSPMEPSRRWQSHRGLPRDQLVISTKKTLPAEDQANPAEEVVKGLEQSLKSLGTDYIDIYHLHGVEPKDYGFEKQTDACDAAPAGSR